MKTTEEWQNRYWKLREGKRDIPKVDGLNQWDILVKEIQLDAWKQGMTDAAKLCFNTKDLSGRAISLDCKHNIEQARDNKESL